MFNLISGNLNTLCNATINPIVKRELVQQRLPLTRVFVALLHLGLAAVEPALRAGGNKVVAMNAKRDVLS